ncbi:MAG: glycosyltransferase family 1 protein [Candidatus Omnitrophota bacterium]
MRIGINARYLQNTRTGIARYVYSLLSNLKKVDTDNEYILFLGSSRLVSEDIRNFGFRNDISKMPTTNQILKMIWQHFYVPRRVKDLKIDVFHEPMFIAPYFKKCPIVVTIHDLAYKFLPDCYTLRNRLYLDLLMKRSISMSDKIIVISEHTKKDVLSNFDVKEQKVEVIPLSVDESFSPITERKEEKEAIVKSKYGITRNFILTVSLISPRKNLVNLIRVFAKLKKTKMSDHQLVIVGKKGWLFKEIFKEAVACDYEKDIIFCDFVSNDDLVKLYNAAEVFVYPSLYEGFGLPLLEAMSCGCPVVASNSSSIPAVCADAAILFDPYDFSGFADAIWRVLTDISLKNCLIEKGKTRATFFSWKRTAMETANVYRSLAL